MSNELAGDLDFIERIALWGKRAGGVLGLRRWASELREAARLDRPSRPISAARCTRRALLVDAYADRLERSDAANLEAKLR